MTYRILPSALLLCLLCACNHDVETNGTSTLVAVYAYTSYRKPSKVFTMIYGKQTEFLSAYMGVHDSTTIAEGGRISIRKGRNNLEGGSFTPYFNEGDTVTVQFSAIPDEAYDYWRKYEDMMNVSANPVFPTNVTLPGNVNGALGYWFGYGSNYYAVIARPYGFTTVPFVTLPCKVSRQNMTFVQPSVEIN